MPRTVSTWEQWEKLFRLHRVCSLNDFYVFFTKIAFKASSCKFSDAQRWNIFSLLNKSRKLCSLSLLKTQVRLESIGTF